MSNSIVPIPVVRVLDETVNLMNDKAYAVVSGGNSITWKQYVSTSYSNTSATLSCPPPSQDIIVSRDVFVSMPVTVNFTGTAPVGQNLLQTGYDSFRAFPISSILQTLQTTINNASQSVNWSDVNVGLMRYFNNQKERFHYYSLVPCMMDQTQNYSDNTGINIRNPLGSYFDSYEEQGGRGGFPYTSFTNTNTTASVSALLTEPLFIAPFLWSDDTGPGFIGVKTMDFTFSWAQDLSRIWSHSTASPSTITSITVSLGQPKLLFRYITPRDVSPIPRQLNYSYFNVDRYPTSSNQLMAPNSTFTIPSNNIQLNSVPNRIYIWAQQSKNLQDFTSTDTFLGITNISIQWGNNSGLLASASQEDLYNISKRNGVSLSYNQWTGNPTYIALDGNNNSYGTVGSVLSLTPGIDLGLPSTEASGINQQIMLQMNVTVKNVNQQLSVVPTLYIVVISEGVFYIYNGSSGQQVGVINKSDVLNAEQSPSITYQMAQKVHGGSFYSGLKTFGRDILSGLQNALPIIEKGFDIGSKIAPYAAPLLMGLGDGGVMVGGAPVGGSPVGGCLYCSNAGCPACKAQMMGSGLLNRNDLRNRLM